MSRRRSTLTRQVLTLAAAALPQPGPAARRRRPRRRRVRLRRPDRRRAGHRWARRRARGGTAHPHATPLPRAWTSSGGWSARAARGAPSTRCRDARGRAVEPSMQLIGRGGPPSRRRPRPRRAPAPGRPPGWPARGSRPAPRLVRRRPRRRSPQRRPPDAPVPRRGRSAHRRQPPHRRGLGGSSARPLSLAATPTSARPERGGHRHGGPGDGLPAAPALAAAAHHGG